MEQLDSLIALQEWSKALAHVRDSSLDPTYIPYLAQQQLITTPTDELTVELFSDLAALLQQPSSADWLAAFSLQLARSSTSSSIVQKAISIGLAAAEKAVEVNEELSELIEARDVEGVRGLSSQEEGTRKVCLLYKALLETKDRFNTWQEIWSHAEDQEQRAVANGDEKEKEKETTAGGVDDEDAAAWGSLDLPTSPGSAPAAELPSGLSPSISIPSLPSFLLDPLTTPAFDLAATASLPPLIVLISRHSSALWPARADILAAVPEWVNPELYRDLLTGVDRDGKEKYWTPNPWRKEPEFLEKVFSAPEDEDRRTAEELSQAYSARVEAVAELGLIHEALKLAQWCANLEVPGLDQLGEELSLLSRLVYDRPPPPPASILPPEEPLTLASYRLLSPPYVLATYLSTSTVDNVVDSIRLLALPYLSVLESRLEREGKPDNSISATLLNTWILNLVSPPIPSTTGTPPPVVPGASSLERLEMLAAIIEASKPTLPFASQRLVRNDEDLARLALACLYACRETGEEAFVLMDKILECLPAFPSAATSPTPSRSSSDLFRLFPPGALTPPSHTIFSHLLSFRASALSSALDSLDLHLTTAETFSRYSCPVPLSWFLASHFDSKAQRAWATRLGRTAAKGGIRKGSEVEGELESEDEWVELMEEMIRLTEGAKPTSEALKKEEQSPGMGKAFWLLEKEEVLRIFFGGLLASGRISLARSLFAGSTSVLTSSAATPPLEPAIVQELVISASREFYDNAEEGNLGTGEMRLAYECLSAAPQTPEIRKEREFIEATSRLCSYNLHSHPGIPLTPIEIRLSKDRLSFVSQLLSTNEDAFRHPEVLLELVQKLGYRGDRLAEVRVLGMVAEAALGHGEFGKVKEMCDRMVEEVEELRKAQVKPPVTREQAVLSPNSNNSRAATPAPSRGDIVHEASDYAWRNCFQLGKHEAFTDLDTRMRALGQALILCPGDKISTLLPVWTRLEEEVDASRSRTKAGMHASTSSALAQGPPPSYLPASFTSTAAHVPHDTAAAAQRTFSRAAGAAAAFFPFSSAPKFERVVSPSHAGEDRPESAQSGGPPASPVRGGRHSGEHEREGGLRAGLSSRLTKGVGWLIGADEERERNGL